MKRTTRNSSGEHDHSGWKHSPMMESPKTTHTFGPGPGKFGTSEIRMPQNSPGKAAQKYMSGGLDPMRMTSSYKPGKMSKYTEE